MAQPHPFHVKQKRLCSEHRPVCRKTGRSAGLSRCRFRGVVDAVLSGRTCRPEAASWLRVRTRTAACCRPYPPLSRDGIGWVRSAPPYNPGGSRRHPIAVVAGQRIARGSLEKEHPREDIAWFRFPKLHRGRGPWVDQSVRHEPFTSTGDFAVHREPGSGPCIDRSSIDAGKCDVDQWGGLAIRIRWPRWGSPVEPESTSARPSGRALNEEWLRPTVSRESANI
ncbi:hypothetical protein RhoFasB10_02270 [Rhodococcus sp. B10]|nr:hypothetical protein [Rhodococcus sp. B10]